MTHDTNGETQQIRPLSTGEKMLSLFLRLIPVKHGKHRLLDRIAPRVKNKSGKSVKVSINGRNTVIDPNDLVGWHFAILKSFDPEVVEILEKSCSQDEKEILWDIGFNKGACSIVMASKIPSLNIVGIEPQSSLAGNNLQNLETVSPRRFEYYQAGLGEEETELILTIPKDNLGGASLHMQQTGPDVKQEKINIYTADKIASLSKFGWPTIIKIDVEGHELQVFRSLEPCLILKTCKVIVFENHRSEKETFKHIREMTEPHGYNIYGVKKTLWSTFLVPSEDQILNITDYALIHEEEIRKNKRLAKLIKIINH